jgi:Na+-driven multidrug efflux pump
MVLLSQPLNSFAFTLDSIFKGIGEMAYLRNVLLGATIFGFLPALYFAKYMEWGLVGIWSALLIWIAYRAIALIIKFKRKYIPLVEN